MEGGAYLPTFCVTFHLKYLPNQSEKLLDAFESKFNFCACQNFSWDPITGGNIGRFEIMDLIFANFSNIFCRLCNEYFGRTFCTIKDTCPGKKLLTPWRCASSKWLANDWLITEDSRDAKASKNSHWNHETSQDYTKPSALWVACGFNFSWIW